MVGITGAEVEWLWEPDVEGARWGLPGDETTEPVVGHCGGGGGCGCCAFCGADDVEILVWAPETDADQVDEGR